MPPEAKVEHGRSVLLVGEDAPPAHAPLDRARQQGWRICRQPDVYAAAVHLLRMAEPVTAVLVRADCLRTDELRFFDLLRRRWPDLACAAIGTGIPSDRRLSLCRQKGVEIVQADGLVDWFSRFALPVEEEPAEPPVTPETPVAAAEPPPTPVEPVCPPAVPASQPVPPSPPIHEMPEDSFVDLPDELVEQMPDDLPEDDHPADAAAVESYEPADLEDDLPETAETHESAPDEAELPDTGSDDLDHVPLTPWSAVPRPHRQPPARRAPRAEPPAADDGADTGPAVQPDGQKPAEPPARPARQDNAGDARELGLLTPEELRALLQDPLDDHGSEEARP